MKRAIDAEYMFDQRIGKMNCVSTMILGVFSLPTVVHSMQDLDNRSTRKKNCYLAYVNTGTHWTSL